MKVSEGIHVWYYNFPVYFSIVIYIAFWYKILYIIYTQNRGIKMLSTTRQEKVRINIQLPAAIKDKLFQASSRQGKKVSALVRESIEEKLNQLDRRDFEERMKVAYQDLAEENLNISEDFKFSDAENLPGPPHDDF